MRTTLPARHWKPRRRCPVGGRRMGGSLCSWYRHSTRLSRRCQVRREISSGFSVQSAAFEGYASGGGYQVPWHHAVHSKPLFRSPLTPCTRPAETILNRPDRLLSGAAVVRHVESGIKRPGGIGLSACSSARALYPGPHTPRHHSDSGKSIRAGFLCPDPAISYEP
jgi:hypothetical protein